MKLYAQLTRDLKTVQSTRHISDRLIEQYTKLDVFTKQQPPMMERIRAVVDEGERPSGLHREKFTVEDTRVVRTFEPLPEAGEKAGAGENGNPVSDPPSPISENAPAAV